MSLAGVQSIDDCEHAVTLYATPVCSRSIPIVLGRVYEAESV
jgi:hypothetical protein